MRQCVGRSYHQTPYVYFAGAWSVSVKTTMHGKSHWTVMLTSKEDKMKWLFVVFKKKGLCLLKNLNNISGIIISFSHYVWTNDSLTIEYIVYLQLVVRSFSCGGHLIVWDAYYNVMLAKLWSRMGMLELAGISSPWRLPNSYKLPT